MSRSSLRAKPIEVTLRDSSGPRTCGCFAQPNVIVFRKAQERSGRVLERVGMEDPRKCATSRTKALQERRACPWRSSSADKALLAIIRSGA